MKFFFRHSGQGVYMVENNVDMYRMWRYLYDTKHNTPVWVHGFRTNLELYSAVSLDDYEGNYMFMQCAARQDFQPLYQLLVLAH